jgi:hypothetical protein
MKSILKLKKLFILINTFSFHSMEENSLIPDALQQQQDTNKHKDHLIIKKEIEKLIQSNVDKNVKIITLTKFNNEKDQLIEKLQISNMEKTEEIENLKKSNIQQIEKIKNLEELNNEKDELLKELIEKLQSSNIEKHNKS